MKEFNQDNHLPDGTILWPEVLICTTQEQAQKLCGFLNTKSFDESWLSWHEEEPELTVEEARHRWANQDFAIYVIEEIPTLSEYPHLYQVSQSLSACKDRFPEITYV